MDGSSSPNNALTACNEGEEFIQLSSWDGVLPHGNSRDIHIFPPFFFLATGYLDVA